MSQSPSPSPDAASASPPAPGETVPPRDEVERSLYAKRQKIYPREVHGLFAWLRIAAVLTLLGIFYGVPWLRWEGRQAVLFDLPARKFHIFGLTFWPQDFIFLSALLIIAALALFFFTTLAGRLWCGYACPQTVWTEVFLWIERKIEGDRPQQMRLDKAPWGPRKLALKSTKHVIWVLLAAWTGFTFVGYFTPILDLGSRLMTFDLGGWETFWVLFYGFATWGNAGWLREQVCIYMCPYARFQSAMFDRDTLIISYDPGRGEPRGPRRRGIDHREKGLGDCIDCKMCVQACPTGIDIRNGLQYECIGCAACIDACDEVMEKMSYPKGLIRYTTENAMEGRPARVLRPRVLVYGFVLLFLFSAVLYGITTRVPLEVHVIRDRNALFRENTNGLIENVYTLRILNMEKTPRTYRVSAAGVPGLELGLADPVITIDAGQVRDLPLRLLADPVDLARRSTEIEFIVETVDEPGRRASEEARFLGPLPGA